MDILEKIVLVCAPRNASMYVDTRTVFVPVLLVIWALIVAKVSNSNVFTIDKGDVNIRMVIEKK